MFNSLFVQINKLETKLEHNTYDLYSRNFTFIFTGHIIIWKMMIIFYECKVIAYGILFL